MGSLSSHWGIGDKISIMLSHMLTVAGCEPNAFFGGTICPESKFDHLSLPSNLSDSEVLIYAYKEWGVTFSVPTQSEESIFKAN